MRLTFVSNYINHHQIPVSDVLYDRLGQNYCFIQTEPMEEERVKMGWEADYEKIPYLRLFYREPNLCQTWIMDSDVVIFGGVEEERYIAPRLEAGKTVIRYSERLYREGQWKAVSPRGLLKKYKDHTRYRNKNVYLLCSGAYVASDFHIIRAYPHKMFQWGYFTETKNYDIDSLFAGKGYVYEESGQRVKAAEILFAGRFLALKHPEYGVALAEHLENRGIPFHVTFVGGGEREEALRREVKEKKLEKKVSFAGYQSPAEVRSFMEKADIFLMTSNYLEGWGAVINEAMNSGCAVIADAKIGAAPFLIRHGENGMVYRDGDREEFCALGEQLAVDRARCRELGKHAYDTIVSLWNPCTAANRLLMFAEGLMKGEIKTWEEGPLSRADVISPGKGYAYIRREKGE